MKEKKHDKRTREWRKHTTYTIWYNMIQRCTNPECPSYADYGGRGIKVCNEWLPSENNPAPLAFRRFMMDVGLRPNQAMSLDRLEVNGNYEKDNVKWATGTEQARNRRNTVMMLDPDSPDPNTKVSAAELAQRAGLSYQTFRYKMQKKGMWPTDNPPTRLVPPQNPHHRLLLDSPPPPPPRLRPRLQPLPTTTQTPVVEVTITSVTVTTSVEDEDEDKNG